MIFTMKTYLNSDKGGNVETILEYAEEHDMILPEGFINAFAYLDYEVELVYEFDTEACTKRLLSVDGMKIETPISLQL